MIQGRVVIEQYRKYIFYFKFLLRVGEYFQFLVFIKILKVKYFGRWQGVEGGLRKKGDVYIGGCRKLFYDMFLGEVEEEN